MAVNLIPDEYPGAQPYLSIAGAGDALEFYKRAFGARELRRMEGPDGKIGHAEIAIGKAVIMLADEFPAMNFRSPKALGGTPVMIHLYVEDVDQLNSKAVAAGIKVLRPLKNEFYGDRVVGYEDPFGHVWHFATHVEDLSEEEVQRRAAAQGQPG